MSMTATDAPKRDIPPDQLVNGNGQFGKLNWQ